MEKFNTIQLVKRRFFALRNGIVADALRRSGLDYKMIFGLNLPQIAEVAAQFGPDAALADELRADRRTRESMMLAPMLCPVETLTPEAASEWLTFAPTAEVADTVCHRLLRRYPQARSLALDHLDDPEPMSRYAALRLLFNLVTAGSLSRPELLHTAARARAEAARHEPLTAPICRALVEEIEFMTEE